MDDELIDYGDGDTLGPQLFFALMRNIERFYSVPRFFCGGQEGGAVVGFEKDTLWENMERKISCGLDGDG